MKKVNFFDQEEILAYGIAFCKKRCMPLHIQFSVIQFLLNCEICFRKYRNSKLPFHIPNFHKFVLIHSDSSPFLNGRYLCLQSLQCCCQRT